MASSGRLARILQRLHSTSSQPSPPLRHCAMVGDGCAGPPYPSMRIDHASASARSASRVAFAAVSRADCARIFAPIKRPWKADCRDLEPIAADYNAARGATQRPPRLEAGREGDIPLLWRQAAAVL